MSHKRRQFLINRTFQFRFSFYVCSWLIALTFSYPLIIANLYDSLISALTHDPLGPQITGLVESKNNLLWLLILMQVALIAITFLISIFMSHKIAGPLYKLKQFFRAAKDGNFTQTLSFRKRDHFQDLAVDYNEMMDSIRNRFADTHDSITNSISFIERALGSSGPASRNDLEVALKTLKDSLTL